MNNSDIHELIESARGLLGACWIADNDGDLSEHVDGALMDRVQRALLNLGVLAGCTCACPDDADGPHAEDCPIHETMRLAGAPEIGQHVSGSEQ